MSRYLAFFWLFVFFALVIGCQSTRFPSGVEAQSYPMDGATAPPDTHIQQLIAPYKNELDAEMNEVVGQAALTLTKDQPESTLGNWMADALKSQAEKLTGQPVDLAILNQGGVRIPQIGIGPITKGTLYQLMPFDNLVVIMPLSGEQLQQFLDHIASSGGWPVSRDLRMRISEGEAVDVTVKGVPLQPEAIYQIALPDYVANGGSNCWFLESLPRNSTGKLLREVLISAVQETDGPISAELEGRIRN